LSRPQHTLFGTEGPVELVVLRGGKEVPVSLERPESP
jgi:hypothetical protein